MLVHMFFAELFVLGFSPSPPKSCRRGGNADRLPAGWTASRTRWCDSTLTFSAEPFAVLPTVLLVGASAYGGSSSRTSFFTLLVIAMASAACSRSLGGILLYYYKWDHRFGVLRSGAMRSSGSRWGRFIWMVIMSGLDSLHRRRRPERPTRSTLATSIA